jgi:hypothetical protein
MSIPAFLARLAVFAALSALCRLAPDPASREMLFAILIVFSLRFLFAPNRACPHCDHGESPVIRPDR